MQSYRKTALLLGAWSLVGACMDHQRGSRATVGEVFHAHPQDHPHPPESGIFAWPPGLQALIHPGGAGFPHGMHHGFAPHNPAANQDATTDAAPAETQTGADDPGPDTREVMPFSFVIIADPHIAHNDQGRRDRLLAGVHWINDHALSKDIELVFIVGDIGWGDQQLAAAKDILDQLAMPYLPIIGDNLIQAQQEEDFENVFGDHFRALASTLTHWNKSDGPVWNPPREVDNHLHNFSFDHRGIHFVGLDWVTRIVAPIFGEQADLHDYDGGTWSWFVEDIATAPKPYQHNVVMTSHHPMLPTIIGGFSGSEFSKLETFLTDYQDSLSANFAGHFHLNTEATAEHAGYTVYVTDATFEDENTLRLVHVTHDGASFLYQHELVEVH